MIKRSIKLNIAKKLIRFVSRGNLADVVTGDETWIHYFELVWQQSTATRYRNVKRPIFAIRILSAKVLYAVFFSIEGKCGSQVQQKYNMEVLQSCCAKKLKKYYETKHPVTGFKRLSSSWQCPNPYLCNSFQLLKTREIFKSVFSLIHQLLYSPPPMFFSFQNGKITLLVENISQDRHLVLQFSNTYRICSTIRRLCL